MKRWLLLLALVVFIAVCGLLVSGRWGGLSSSEPSYEGRSLSSWLSDFGSRPIGSGLIHDKLSKTRRRSPTGGTATWNVGLENPSSARLPPAASSPGIAIRAMGTNALEPLLRKIKCSDDPSWLAAVKQALNKQKFLQLRLRDPQTEREQAAMALYELGNAGVSALPELANLLTNYSSAVYAAHALAGMGAAALPAFASALTNSNTWINACGVWGLAQIGPESRVAVPQMLPFLRAANTTDVRITMWALSEIREPSEVIRPELVRLLGHSDPEVRRFAAEALQKFGADVKPNMGEIKAAWDGETDAKVRSALQKLIEEAEPVGEK